jgi:hypothetical protein
MPNAFVECFNGKFRNECLNGRKVCSPGRCGAFLQLAAPGGEAASASALLLSAIALAD